MNFGIVVLVGGKGSRVASLLNGKSKPELNITKNKKIIDFQLDKLTKYNKKIFFLSNYRFQTLKKYLKKKYSKFLNYEIIEETNELGTAGALKILEKKKFENFLIIDGDLLFNVDFKKFLSSHQKNKSDCTLLIHPNNHPYDSDAVEIDKNNKVTKIYKKNDKFKPNNCLSGIKIIKKNCLKFIELNKSQDFTKDFLPKIFKHKKKIYGYETREYIKDIGTPDRIIQAKFEIKTKKYKNGSLKKTLPAIFIDKDGVINKLNKKKHYQSVKNIIPGSIKALKLINNSKFLSVMITNQPAIAKGIISEKKFKNDLKFLTSKLGKKNVFLDKIYYCPHHPEKGYKNEIHHLKINCKCRKPKNGLFLKAIKELNIDVKNSFMIGDQFSDFLASKKTNLRFVGVNFGLKNNKKIIYKKNFLNAVRFILKF